MSPEGLVSSYFEQCAALIAPLAAHEVRQYLACGEVEMAFEGLIIELIAAEATPPNFDYDQWKRLGEELGLDQEPVFDSDIWAKFIQWSRSRGT